MTERQGSDCDWQHHSWRIARAFGGRRGWRGTLITAVTASLTAQTVHRWASISAKIQLRRIYASWYRVNHTPSLSAEGVTQAPSQWTSCFQQYSTVRSCNTWYCKISQEHRSHLLERPSQTISFRDRNSQLRTSVMYQLLLARLTYCGSLTEDLDKTRISSFIIWPHIYPVRFQSPECALHCKPGTMSSATTVTVRQMTAVLTQPRFR
jgi:hypothetical protein